MMKKTKKFICALAVISMVMATYSAAPARFKGSKGPAGAQGFTSDAIVLQWNEIAVTTIGAQPPFPSTRYMATVQVAVFEAVNAITGDYEPYLGTITAPPGASTEAAAVAAAHGVLKAFFPAQSANLDQQRADSLATIPDGQAKNDGIAVGEAAAAAMVANRTNDGSAPPQFHTPPNVDPYEWQTTAGCPLRAASSSIGQM